MGKTIARGVAGVVGFAGMSLIIWNAVAQAVRDENYLLAAAEFAAFPVTLVVYPFLAGDDSLAWPLAEGTNLIPVLLVTVAAWVVVGLTDDATGVA